MEACPGHHWVGDWGCIGRILCLFGFEAQKIFESEVAQGLCFFANCTGTPLPVTPLLVHSQSASIYCVFSPVNYRDSLYQVFVPGKGAATRSDHRCLPCRCQGQANRRKSPGGVQSSRVSASPPAAALAPPAKSRVRTRCRQQRQQSLSGLPTWPLRP